MDSGTAHPFAFGSELELAGLLATDAHVLFEVAVLGDLVCLKMDSVGEDEERGQLWVVNWKTGQVCMVSNEMIYVFSFLHLDFRRRFMVSASVLAASPSWTPTGFS